MSAARETVKAIRHLLGLLSSAERQLRRGKISGDEMEQIGDDVAEKARH